MKQATKIFISCLLFLILSKVSTDEYHSNKIKYPKVDTDEDKHFWYSQGNDDLQASLAKTRNTHVAKNVILFIGDGMGITTLNGARIYKGQQEGQTGEESSLSFENFPHLGMAKTYNVDFQVADSASTATAYLAGVKTNSGVLGYDANINVGRCENHTVESTVDSVALWALQAGKKAGLVTTARITHATPAALYSHSANRNWECDRAMTDGVLDRCPDAKDIARQLFEDEPGRSLSVVLGGGLQYIDAYAEDPDIFDCVRQDNRTLWQEWLDEKEAAGNTAKFVTNRTEMLAANPVETDYLMGIFSNSHLPYEHSRGEDVPSLTEMTEKAISFLNQHPDGYFLLVESGRIDHANHNNRARIAFEETLELSNAVELARAMTSELDTLIIVTADHSHTLTIAGYPDRGNPITGVVGYTADDDMNYTTLSYALGPGYNFTNVDGEARRKNPDDFDLNSYNYESHATLWSSLGTHSGEDVPIYSSGPMAHLFHSVHEQNYIAHAMAYASCVGPNLNHCST